MKILTRILLKLAPALGVATAFLLVCGIGEPAWARVRTLADDSFTSRVDVPKITTVRRGEEQRLGSAYHWFTRQPANPNDSSARRAVESSPEMVRAPGFRGDRPSRVRMEPLGHGRRRFPPLRTAQLSRELAGGPQRGEAPVRTVVIDPGHGGDSAGSHGPSGQLEKDVVLDLARAVADTLRRQGFLVYLTRTDDRSMRADHRAAVVNYRKADLFLSLHASGIGRPQARGFEIMVAPQPPFGTDSRLWVGGQVGKAARSRYWAELLRSALGEALHTYDRGVTEAPNPVLEAADAPACLLEAASLAWPGEEDLLQTAAGRANLARGISRAVHAFFRAPPDGQTPGTFQREP